MRGKKTALLWLSMSCSIALIAIVCLGAITLMGTNASAKLTTAAGTLQ